MDVLLRPVHQRVTLDKAGANIDHEIVSIHHKCVRRAFLVFLVVNTSKTVRILVSKDGHEFLTHIMTGEETWCGIYPRSL